MNHEDLKRRVEHYLQTEVAEALGMKGDGIAVVGVDGGIAQVRFTGACASCPASLMSVIMGLEQELRSRFPEVQFLEAVP